MLLTGISKPTTNPNNHSKLKATIKHDRRLGIHQGIICTMSIRTYPRPWYFFMDTSPNTDEDSEVIAKFDKALSQ